MIYFKLKDVITRRRKIAHRFPLFILSEMQNGSPVGLQREPVPSTSAAAAATSAGDNTNQPQNYGRTPLHDAAINGDDETLERLLRAGADRNAKDTQHGNTPLHEAGE